MTTTLAQSTTAAFPDRPVSGGSGLLVALAPGNDGAYLTQPLASPANQLHVRVMARFDALANGTVSFLRLVDSNGEQLVDLRFDASADALSIIADDDSINLPIASALAWHCIELRTDVQSLSVEVWVNGRSVGSLAPAALTDIAEVWLGAIIKSTAASGDLALDELIISDQYIGPVLVTPASDFALDPARWLVLYNTASPDSLAWVQTYRDARQIPYANLLGLDLPTIEQITKAQFQLLRDEVSQYLSANNLAAQIMGLLCGHDVPGTYMRDGGDKAMIGAQLQFISSTDSVVANPFASSTLPSRLRATDLSGQRLTARIDSPTLAQSLALHQRAIDLQSMGMGDGGEATIWLDASGSGGVYESRQQQMLDWATGLARQRLRLPIEMTDLTDPQLDVQFTSIDRDGFFLGWHQATVPDGFFASPAGKRIFAMQLSDQFATASTLRDAQSSQWANAALHAGYAATAGSSDVSFIEAAPILETFFDALRSGWTLAEAWFTSSALLRSPTVLIGDPLLTASFPAQGWDVFGPFADRAAIRFDQPSAHLRESEMSLELTHEDLNGFEQGAVFALRHVDEWGRSDGQAMVVDLSKVSGQWRTRPMLPIWPVHARWAARLVEGQALVDVVWPGPIRAQGIAAVKLYAQPDGEAATVVDVVTPAGLAHAVQLTFALTVTPTILWVSMVDTLAEEWPLPASRPLWLDAVEPVLLTSV